MFHCYLKLFQLAGAHQRHVMTIEIIPNALLNETATFNLTRDALQI